MTPTPRPASDPLSALGKIAAPFIKDALREEAYKERIRALTAELAEAKRLSEQYLAASRDNLECYRRAEKERDAALVELKEATELATGYGTYVRKELLEQARAENEALNKLLDDIDTLSCEGNVIREIRERRARLAPPATAPWPFDDCACCGYPFSSPAPRLCETPEGHKPASGGGSA